jgi:hypothetical protein
VGLYPIIALSVGGNDLCSASRKPVDVVRNLMIRAQKLVESGTEGYYLSTFAQS